MKLDLSVLRKGEILRGENWREAAELHNLHASPNFVRVIKSRMRWADM